MTPVRGSKNASKDDTEKIDIFKKFLKNKNDSANWLLCRKDLPGNNVYNQIMDKVWNLFLP